MKHGAITRCALTALFLLSALGVSTGCSLLGTGPSDPEGLPHAGVGPYRDLTPAETNLSRAGVPVLLRGTAAERPMMAGLHLFYAGASTRIEEPDAGMPDAGEDLDAGVADAGEMLDAGVADAGPPEMPGEDVDWDAFDEGRRIFRSAPRDSDWGFDTGSAVLTVPTGKAATSPSRGRSRPTMARCSTTPRPAASASRAPAASTDRSPASGPRRSSA